MQSRIPEKYALKPLRLSAGAVCLALLTACSLFSSGPKAASFALPRELSRLPEGWHSERISSKPYIYRFTGPELREGDSPLFGTVIRECFGGRSKLSQSIRSKTRQLFVGIKKLDILEQRKWNLEDGSVLWWVVLASFENKPILISTYSSSMESCSVDYVLWNFPAHTDTDENSEPTLETSLEQFVSASKLFGETLPFFEEGTQS